MQDVNNRIETFAYNYIDKSNKPRSLFFAPGKGGRKIKIKQSASEMLCLTRYLGLMIGDMIPAGNEDWKLYHLLRKIIDSLTSPSLTRGQIKIVDDLIHEHNSLFLKLYGALKPKMHFWLHYARIMLLFGPVINFSSDKYGKKNKKLKEIAVGTTCNHNLLLTIAIRHQLQMCHVVECENSNPGKDFVIGPVANSNTKAALQKLVPTVQESLIVQTLKHVEILGKTFSTETVFTLRITEEGPEFGNMEEIFYCNDSLFYFHVKPYENLYFNHYYHAYSISSNTDKANVLVNVNLIPRLPPCLYIKKQDEELIVPRYAI